MTIEIRRLEGEPRVIVQQQLTTWQVFGYVGDTCVLNGEALTEAGAIRLANKFEKAIEKR